MKKRLMLMATLVAALALLTVTGAGASGGGSKVATGSFRDGPYTATTPDSGTCGNNWAQDLFLRKFVVSLPANLDGTYTVKETFAKGHFSTIGGASPESCEAHNHNTIKEGRVGTFNGTFTITVSNGTLNTATGACEKTNYGDLSDPSTTIFTQCDTAGWIHGFFGDSATYSIGTFNFVYNASTALPRHHWVNSSAGNSGDIASTLAP